LSGTRTSRIAGGVALSLVHKVVAVLVGLWVTRFLLERLGEAPYGLWLVALQLAAWLSLADLGVVGILPRQAAFASGRSNPEREVAQVAGETLRLVLWQWPLVALLSIGLWFFVPERWADLRGPLALLLTGFVVTFPLRVLPALVEGLQDLVFAGWVAIVSWALNTAIAVALIFAGAGLYALAAGWIATQTIPPLICLLRLRSRHPGVLPPRLPPLTRSLTREHLSRSVWVSVSQLAGALGSGADVLLIGLVLGPAALVPYVITGKLFNVAGSLPLTLAQQSGPALSQLRVAEGPDRLRQATGALSQAVLVSGGAIAAAALAANPGFVAWWVGPDRFAGMTLTALFAAVMLARHYGTTLVFAVFAFGHERAIALAGLAEGAAGVTLALLLIGPLGLSGALAGQVAAVLVVTVPLLLPLLARATGSRRRTLLAGLFPWAWRAAPALLAAVLLADALPPTLTGAALGAGVAVLLYAALMLPLVLREPLRGYVAQLARRLPRVRSAAQ
jgi:O-antigen/teichoic acid export membrane protein